MVAKQRYLDRRAGATERRGGKTDEDDGEIGTGAREIMAHM